MASDPCLRREDKGESGSMGEEVVVVACLVKWSYGPPRPAS